MEEIIQQVTTGGWYEMFLDGRVWAIIGAAIVVILTGMGSAKGVSMVGDAGIAVVTEDPDKFGQVLLLQALPGTQGIYGLLTAFIVLNKIGMIGGESVTVSLGAGIMLFLAVLPITIVGYGSAILQAKEAVAAVSLVAEKPEELAKGMVMAAMVETYAVLAVLISVLIAMGVQI